MIDLPALTYEPGRGLVIDTVGKAYLADHTLRAHCSRCNRSSLLDLVEIIERRGHGWPLARIKVRCTACRKPATIVHGHVRWLVDGHTMPYPQPPGPDRDRAAWAADYATYRERRATTDRKETPPAEADGAS